MVLLIKHLEMEVLVVVAPIMLVVFIMEEQQSHQYKDLPVEMVIH